MLEVIDLAKRYGPVVALDGATFSARPGRIVGFLGPNGAGQSSGSKIPGSPPACQKTIRRPSHAPLRTVAIRPARALAV